MKEHKKKFKFQALDLKKNYLKSYKINIIFQIDADQLPTFLGGEAPDLLSHNKGPWNPLGLEY